MRCDAMRCDAMQAKALERGELRPGALVPVEALQGCLFPCASSSSSSTPLFASSILAPRSGRPLDRFVGVTDQQVLELEAHRTRMNQVGFSGLCLGITTYRNVGEYRLKA